MTTDEQIAALTAQIQALTAAIVAAQTVQPGSWLANQGLFGTPVSAPVIQPGQWRAPSGKLWTIPDGFELVYGEVPKYAHFSGVNRNLYRAALQRYEELLSQWGGLIEAGHPNHPDAQQLALSNKAYVEYGMGEVLLFLRSSGPAAAWPKGGVKRGIFNPTPESPNNPAPLRPFIWPDAEEAANPSRADDIIAHYQVDRRGDGLPIVGKPSTLLIVNPT